MLLTVCTNACKHFTNSQERPDLEAMVSCGIFEDCISCVALFAATGAEGLDEINPGSVIAALKILNFCRDQPGCADRIRSIAPALTFALDNDIPYLPDTGHTTGAAAAQLCCAIFGRDDGESGSEFTFTRQHVEMMLTTWSQIVRGVGTKSIEKPSPDRIKAGEEGKLLSLHCPRRGLPESPP